MNILFNIPFFIGLTPLLYGKDKPIGMPAVYKLLDELKKRGNNVLIVSPSNLIDIVEIWRGNNEIVRNGIKIYILPPQTVFIPKLRKHVIGIRFSNLLFYIYYFWKINKIVRKERPHLIYSAFQLGLIGNIIAKTYKIPSILRAYGTHLGGAVRPGNVESLKFILNNITAAITFKFHHYSYLIMTNDGTKGDVVSRASGVPEEKLKFWINGVDKNVEYIIPDYQIKQMRKELNIDPANKIILTVSRLFFWKRIDRVVRCAPYVKSNISNVQFVIIGGGPEYDNLQELIKKHEAGSYIKLLSFKPHSEIYKYMQIADIFVSVYDVSNLCNPVLEAMTCGKCIISLNDGSLDSIIENGKNGILVEAERVDKELPEAIVNLLRNKALRDNLGREARIFAENNLDTWDERIDKEIKLLETVVNEYEKKNI